MDQKWSISWGWRCSSILVTAGLLHTSVSMIHWCIMLSVMTARVELKNLSQCYCAHHRYHMDLLHWDWRWAIMVRSFYLIGWGIDQSKPNSSVKWKFVLPLFFARKFQNSCMLWNYLALFTFFHTWMIMCICQCVLFDIYINPYIIYFS